MTGGGWAWVTAPSVKRPADMPAMVRKIFVFLFNFRISSPLKSAELRYLEKLKSTSATPLSETVTVLSWIPSVGCHAFTV